MHLRPDVKIRRPVQRSVQQLAIVPLGDFYRPELAQVIRDELRIKKREATRFEPRNKVDEGEFRAIPLEMEHAFPEKGAAQSKAV